MTNSLQKLAGSIALVCAMAAAPVSANKLTTTEISDNIYMIKGAGGNIAVSVGEDGLLMVDAFIKRASEALKAEVDKLGKGKLKYVLNTHWHGDHTGGNETFNRLAPVVAHENVRKRMMVDNENFFGKKPASPEEALPVVTFSQRMTLYFNDDVIKLKHYPMGHTDGDTMVYFKKANVLHMGDNYFNGMYPFVDLTTGGSVLGLLESIGKVLKEFPDDVTIIPGHGKLATKQDLQGYHDMIKSSVNTVKKAMKAGKTLEQIQAAGLDASLDPWGKGFIPEKAWIGFVYDSIKLRQDSKHERGEGRRAHGHGHGGNAHHH